MRILGTVASSSREVPNAPTIGTATNVGTGRAFNNGRADVTFTAPTFDGGLPITGYTVTSSPGGFTGTGASSPITVTGLQSGTSYTFTVTATNSRGTSAASAASNSITATTVPQAPTIGTATRTNNTTVSLTFTAGATGGSAITSYTATSSPSISLSTSGTSSPLTITGSYITGQAYTFTIVATNANGTSTASGSSNSITPNLPTGIIQSWSTGTIIPDNGYATSRYFGSGIAYSGSSVELFTAGGGSTENKTNYLLSPPNGSWATGTNLNVIYNAGAHNTTSNYSDTVFVRTTSALRTIVYNATAWTNRTNPPRSLNNASDSGDSSGVYYVGYYVSGSTSNAVYRFTFASNWVSMANYPTNISNSNSAAGNGLVVVAGGSPTGSYTNDTNVAYSYSQSGNAWTSIANLPVNKYGGAGFFVGTTSAGTVNRYYVGMGFPPSTNAGASDIYSYSASTGSWRTETSAAVANRWTNMFYDVVNYRLYENGGDSIGSQLNNYYATII